MASVEPPEIAPPQAMAPAPGAFLRATALTVACATVSVLPAYLTGALAVQMRADIGFGRAGQGVAVGAFFAANALTTVWMGRLVERVGTIPGVRLGLALSAVASVGIVLAPPGLGVLVALLAVAGVGNGVMGPALALLTSRRVPVDRQGLAFGVKQGGVSMAALLGGVAVPAVALTVGWRWAFAGAAVAAAALLAAPRRAPEDGPSPRRGATAAVPAQDGGRPDAALLLLTVAFALGSSAAMAVGAFLVDAGVEAGLAEGAAGLTLAAASLAAVAARVVSGWAVDRSHRDHLAVVAAMIAVGTVGYLLLATGDRTLFVVGGMIAYGAGWGWVGLLVFAVVDLHPAAPARATGVAQVGAATGGVAGPLLLALVAQRLGYEAGWLAAAVLAALGGGCVVLGRRAAARAAAAAPATADSGKPVVDLREDVVGD